MKTWSINVGGRSCEISLKRNKVLVDGESYPLKSLPKTSKIGIFYEYQLPVEGAQVLLVTGLWAMELVMDSAYVHNGKPYVPIGKVPGWAWVFVVLHACNLAFGAIGGLFAAIGALMTLRVAGNQNLSTRAKVGISVAIWIGCSVAVWVLGFAFVIAVGGLA